MALPVYHSVKSHVGTIEGVSFVVAEVPAVNGRQHRRVIGLAPQDPALHGKPLVYADSYPLDNERTIVYARHRTSPAEFVAELDNFFLEQLVDFPELRRRLFQCQMNIAGELVEDEVGLPFTEFTNIVGLDYLRFLRLSIPFGDLAIEFGTPTLEIPNQLSGLNRHQLPRALETPLVGCDLTKASVLAVLMSRLHWASDRIPPQILERLIDQMNLVPA